jgi:hypothetical protein
MNKIDTLHNNFVEKMTNFTSKNLIQFDLFEDFSQKLILTIL